MQPEIKKHLYDILTSANAVDEYLADNRTFEFYLSSKVVRRAVEREIEIIGEAVGRILKIDNNFALENARSIVNTRNRVIHAYDSVDNTVMWGIVIRHLPLLKEEVERLLKE